MKNISIFILLITLSFAGIAQIKVKKDGSGNYIALNETKKIKPGTLTGQTFKAADGKIYPIYKSINGKFYIIRVSKKTGKEYKQYLSI